MLRCLVIICTGIFFAMHLPTACHAFDIDNQSGMEWKVSYKADEDWASLPFKKRPVAAIRFKVTLDLTTGKYMGQLWLFTGTLSGGSTVYTFLGKTDRFELMTEGSTTGRGRRGFRTRTPIEVKNGTTLIKKVHVSGIWQHGRHTGDRTADRLQLKVNHHARITTPVAQQAPGVVPVPAPGGCEDDPDSDVLEEGGEAGGDDPPTEP